MNIPFNGLLLSPWVFLILKFITLALLYGFILRIITILTSDIKGRTTAKNQAGVQGAPQFCRGTYALVVVDSSYDDIRAGNSYPLKKDITIGRGANNSIQINDSIVSHEHARLFLRDGIFYVEDLNSKNGTIVEGKTIISPVPLKDGTLLQVGKVTFKLARWENESS